VPALRVALPQAASQFRNLLTDQVSNSAAETIQLCISAPVSDVVLDL